MHCYFAHSPSIIPHPPRPAFLLHLYRYSLRQLGQHAFLTLESPTPVFIWHCSTENNGKKRKDSIFNEFSEKKYPKLRSLIFAHTCSINASLPPIPNYSLRQLSQVFFCLFIATSLFSFGVIQDKK